MELNLLTKKLAKDKKKILKNWPKLLALRRQIARDYNLAAEIKILSSVAWRVWGDKKRHRTVPEVVESIYYCIERAIKKLKAQSSKLPPTLSKFHVGLFSRVPFEMLRRAGKTTTQNLKLFDSVFSIPPTIRRHPHFLQRYLNCAFDSLACYQKLVNLGIRPPDAVFVIPRGLRIDVLQSYNLYNLISGYYPLRLCTTVEEQLRAITGQEVLAIKKMLRRKKFPELAEAIAVKCQQTCFCHEEKFCGQIKETVKDYDEEFHRRLLRSLEKRYERGLLNG